METGGFLGMCAFLARRSHQAKTAADHRCVAFAAGYIEQWHTASNYCLKEMCVDPALHRRGIGTALMDRLVARVARMGVRSVRLGTRRGSAAEAFYRKMGFVAADWLVHMKREITPADAGAAP